MKLKPLAELIGKAFGCWMPRNPIEVLQRPLLKGAATVSVQSSNNQFAGLTTLASGQTTVPLSTTALASGAILAISLMAALPSAFQTQGRVSIASGTSFGTASTQAVYSGDVINLSWESPNAITSGQALRINSIVDGVSFAISTSNSLTTVASGAVAMWRIEGKDANAVKVNTIADGYAILGWADGNARPYPTTVMWEVKRTG